MHCAQRNTLVGMVSATCLFLLPGIVSAQVSAPTVTFSNGLYHYDYSISNTSADDLFDVDIHVLPGVGVVSNVSAPVGFMTAYDSGLGLVSYLEDASFFTATPLSGFSYDSASAPMPSTFDANYVSLATGAINTVSGPIPAAVPEPGTAALFASIGTAAGFAARRKRRRNHT